MAEINKKVLIQDIEEKIIYFNKFVELSNKSQVDEPKTMEDVQEKVLSEKVDKLLYSTETSYLFSEIIFSILFLKQFTTVNEFEIISKFLEEKGSLLKKRKFHIKGEEIMENEKGSLEKNRKLILESPEFKKTVEFLENMSPQ
mgnify:FL=1